MTTTEGLPVGAYLVHRGRLLVLECTRCDHLEHFPPARGRAAVVRGALTAHDLTHDVEDERRDGIGLLPG